MELKHYYEARQSKETGLWTGVVYHYDASGNRAIILYVSGEFDDEHEAIDRAVEWAEDYGIDVELA